jgi:hypothetical protein
MLSFTGSGRPEPSVPCSATLSRSIANSSVRDPHLNLLYKSLTPEVQKELAATIKLPIQEVSFDSIVAVRAVSPIENGADVEAWKVLVQKSLRE